MSATNGPVNPNVQPALIKAPGRFSALCAYRKPSQAHVAVRDAVARLMRFFAGADQPDDLRVLVALSPNVLEDMSGFDLEQAGAARSAIKAPFMQDETYVLVQIAAQNDAHRLYAARVAEEALSPALQEHGEVFGSRMLNGLEAFGFRDGTDGEVWKTAAGNLSPTGAWLFYQRFTQKVADFFASNGSFDEQSAIMGRPPMIKAGASAEETRIARMSKRASGPALGSHYQVMHGALKEGDLLIRRGFPFRHDGSDGFAFVGVSNRAALFGELLARMKENDALMRYVTPTAGGLFFCPPNADWLDQGKSEPLEPRTVMPFVHANRLIAYDTTTEFITYLMKLKAVGLFDNPDRPTSISPSARSLMDALYERLAGSARVQELQQAEQAAIASAGALTDYYGDGEYFTYG